MSDQIKILLERYPALTSCKEEITEALNTLISSYENGGKLLICGNGGSAADADHIAGELLKGFNSKRPLPENWKEKLGPALAGKLQDALPTIPLPNFSGLLTAYGNDCDPEYGFAQLTWGLGNKNDCLLGISTSGNSTNVLHAAKVATQKDMKVIGLTGASGGKLKDLSDTCICAPQSEVYKIQEFHLPIYHTLCLALEEHFFP